MTLKPIDSPETLGDWVFPWPHFNVDWSRSALLVVDYQNYSANPDVGLLRMLRDKLPAVADYYADRLALTIPNTRRLIDAFRARNLEVIYTRHGALLPDGRDMIARRRRRDNDAKTTTGRPAMWSAGTLEHAIVDALTPLPDDLVIDKNTSSAFNGTGIDFLLHNLGIETLVVTDTATDMCVETNSRDAADRGYNVIVAEDAVATFYEEHHRNSLSGLARVFVQVWDTQHVLRELSLAPGSHHGT